MRLELLIPLLFSLPMGLSMFVVLSRYHLAHLKSLKDLIKFYFNPRPPYRMLIVESLDGRISVFYDDDYEELKAEDRTLIRTRYGDQYVTKVPPSQASEVVSMFDAKGPAGFPSPFGLSWRWAIGAAVTTYMLYYALLVALFPVDGTLNPWEILLTTSLMIAWSAFMFMNLMRFNDASIKYAWYHSVGINPPHEIILPSPSLSSLSLVEYFKHLGREIVIRIGDELKPLLDVLTEKVGSKSLAASILARLAMSETWRKGLAEVLQEKMDLIIAGDTARRIRYGEYGPISKKTIGIMIGIFIVGLVIGYLFGNAYGFSVAPVHNATSTTLPVHTITPHIVNPTPSYTTTTPMPHHVITTTTPTTNTTVTGIHPASPPPPG